MNRVIWNTDFVFRIVRDCVILKCCVFEEKNICCCENICYKF